MGLFRKKVIREIADGAWGQLVNVHGISVDTLYREMRCVERAGTLDGEKVNFLRVFRPMEAQQRGITVTGWETFDQHPDLIIFEGYLTESNKAHLERKKT